MTMESDLVTRLKTACPRVFPDFAPTSTTRPYVTYQRIGGDALNYVDNSIPTERNTTVQVDVWADTRLSATALIGQIEDALRTASAFTARPLSGAIDDYDADIPVYSTLMHFSVWATR